MLELDYINKEYVSEYLKPRPSETHKGQCGRVLIIAGTLGMVGTAILSAKAAYKSGAGLVTVAIPKDLFPIVQTAVPEATVVSRSRLLLLEEGGYLKKFNAIAIGPGFGVSEDNMYLIEKVLSKTQCPIIIDADGLNTICQYNKDFSAISKYSDQERIILTPHVGEANKILACAGSEGVKELGREAAVKEIADFTEATVLLKGAGTLVTCPFDDISYNTTGNPGMATGGSGDVLTGVIAAVAASGLKCSVAARIGAYMHGLAGDKAAEVLGEYGMTSVDITSYLPAAFKDIIGR